MPSRRNRDSPFTLFFFQDIITCVSGVMILLMLLFAISAPEEPGESGDSQVSVQFQEADRSEEVQALRGKIIGLRKTIDRTVHSQEVVQLESKINPLSQDQKKRAAELKNLLFETGRLESRIETLQARRQQVRANIEKNKLVKDVRYIPEESDGMTPILVECSRNGMLVGVSGRNLEPVNFGYAEDLSFIRYLKTLQPRSHFFVFLLKPSAPEALWQALVIAKSAGFQVGYDALEETHTVNFSESMQ